MFLIHPINSPCLLTLSFLLSHCSRCITAHAFPYPVMVTICGYLILPRIRRFTVYSCTSRFVHAVPTRATMVDMNTSALFLVICHSSPFHHTPDPNEKIQLYLLYTFQISLSLLHIDGCVTRSHFRLDDGCQVDG